MGLLKEAACRLSHWYNGNPVPAATRTDSAPVDYVSYDNCADTSDIQYDTGAECARMFESELPDQRSGTVRIVCISDTHELHHMIRLPRTGDVLIHAGDIMFADRLVPEWVSKRRLKDFLEWFNSAPQSHKVFVGGNHDVIIEKLGIHKVKKMASPAILLNNEAVSLTIEQPSPPAGSAAGTRESQPLKLNVFGTPASVPNSHRSPNRAFQNPGDMGLTRDRITFCELFDTHHRLVDAADVVITHQGLNRSVDLGYALAVLGGKTGKRSSARHGSVAPRLHVCGHLHKSRGASLIPAVGGSTALVSVNAAVMQGTSIINEQVSVPIVIDVPAVVAADLGV